MTPAFSPNVPMPPRTAETRPFWDACQEGNLLLCKCKRCGEVYLYREKGCLKCRSAEREWAQASGKGTLYSYMIAHHRAYGLDADEASVIAVVALEEGPRIMCDLVDIRQGGLDRLTIGMAVEVVFRSLDGRVAGYAFRPIWTSKLPCAHI